MGTRRGSPGVLLAALACSAASGQPQYQATIIQARQCQLTGWPRTVALGVNDLGDVVGYHFQCDFDFGDHSAFLWTGQSGLVTLDLPPGFQFHEAEAHDINGSGQIVGFVRTNVSQFLMRAVKWERGEVVELGVLPGSDNSWANAINDRGQIVGVSVNTTFGPYRPFLWENGVMKDLELPLGRNGGANDINDLGEIVGWMGAEKTVARPFLFHDGQAIELDAVPVAVASYAIAINNRRQVVIHANLEIKGGHYIVHSFLWDDGDVVDLGTLPGTTSTRAQAINDAGQIVGFCNDQSGAVTKAFVWEDGAIAELTSLLVNAPDFEVRQAWSINGVGQIAGRTWNGQQAQGVLLSPAAPSADLDGSGEVDAMDLELLLDSWGPCSCPADLDGDGGVGMTDLLMLLAAWG